MSPPLYEATGTFGVELTSNVDVAVEVHVLDGSVAVTVYNFVPKVAAVKVGFATVADESSVEGDQE